MSNAVNENDLRADLESYIWDAYKDLNGIRPRHLRLDLLTVDQLRLLADQLEARIIEDLERERIEREALIAREAEFQAIRNTTNVIMWEVEPEGVVEFESQKWDWYINEASPRVTFEDLGALYETK